MQLHMQGFVPRRAATYKTITRLPVRYLNNPKFSIETVLNLVNVFINGIPQIDPTNFLNEHDIIFHNNALLLPIGLMVHISKGSLWGDNVSFSIYLKHNKKHSLARSYGVLNAENTIPFILEKV